MKRVLFSLATAICLNMAFAAPPKYSFWPAPGADNVNIDTKLLIRFNGATPVRGNSGKIRVYDLTDGVYVDSIDMLIPDGPDKSREYPPECHYTYTPYDYARVATPTNRTCTPGTPSGEAEPTPPEYQLNIIGGFTDAFHFRPVICKDNIAEISLHNNMLDYGHTYRVEIEQPVLTGVPFKGVDRKNAWTFTTKKAPTCTDTIRVAADGSGDFNTVQGALDFIPDFSEKPYTILVAAGDYEEIVYARNKTNVTIIGEGSDCTRVHYATNEVFNPHPVLVKTNEYPGTFPSRRAPFMLDNCHDIVIRDICFATDLTGQAEGLLLNGERIALYDVHIIGSGDALQANGTVYMRRCRIDGHGDTILGRGSLFALECDFCNEGGPFTWVRNTQGHHGDVFVNCTFSCPDGRKCDYGRTPANKGSKYPHAEIVVIDCRVRNLDPAGWSAIGEPTARMLEYNTRDLDTGSLVDTSQRHPFSRQLDAVADKALLECYRNPAFVLKGWRPAE